MLDTHYLEDLRPMEGPRGLHRERLLSLLERDLPDHIICTFCKKLHAINKARRRLDLGYNYLNHSKCWKADYDSLTDFYIHQDFQSSVFEMTMKRYRQGSDYSNLLGLLSLKSITRSISEYVEQRTAAAKLINGSLLVREQKMFMIPAMQPIPIPWNAVICRHIKYLNSEDLTYFLRDMDSKTQTGHLSKERVMGCRYCRSEYQIDVKQYGERGNAMYVTKWLDLGQGPLGHNFRSHLHNDGGLPWREIDSDLGSIRAAFEGGAHFDFDSDAFMKPKDREEVPKLSWFG